MSTPQATDLHALQQRLDVLATERELYNLVQDYAGYHDLCFGKGAGPEDDAKWESLLTPDAVSDLHPLGIHHGRDGKMAWAQKSMGGRGQGCQLMISNVRITLDTTDPTSAIGRAYVLLEVVPEDASKTFITKGRYIWKFHKFDGVWKVANVKLSPFPEL